ncbi:MAG TPA: glycerophosphodiester phosphodiesterase family protein [Vicinamibacterales bacterium]|nr:glycerophosphodiester phosphodiesterase family protein [Vicinamibacterales bacterium]
MRHPFFTSSRPLVFAHRGGAALAPENTLVAFTNGVALGSDGIELDVRASRDGRVVVHHDETLDRTTALRGPLRDRTADELAAARVPELSQVLRACRDVRVIVEIKVNEPEFGRRVVEELRRADAIERTCVGGFRRAVIRAVRDAEPALATSAAREEVRLALYRSWLRWPVRGTPYAGYQVPERRGATRVVSRRFIDDAHRAGLGVQVWTVNDGAAARRLLAWGVDALITDRPDLMVPLVRGVTARPA